MLILCCLAPFRISHAQIRSRVRPACTVSHRLRETCFDGSCAAQGQTRSCGQAYACTPIVARRMHSMMPSGIINHARGLSKISRQIINRFQSSRFGTLQVSLVFFHRRDSTKTMTMMSCLYLHVQSLHRGFLAAPHKLCGYIGMFDSVPPSRCASANACAHVDEPSTRPRITAACEKRHNCQRHAPAYGTVPHAYRRVSGENAPPPKKELALPPRLNAAYQSGRYVIGG